MKKIVLALGIILFSLVKSQAAQAGTLNEQEAEIVKAAKGQFESEGAYYQVDPSYISQLIEYLSTDDVDLTKEQKEKVLQLVNDYIETGIKEKYLIPVGEQQSNTDTISNANAPENGTTTQAPDKNTEPINSDDKVQPTKGAEGSTEVDTDNLLQLVENIENNLNEADNSIIKNTGFNFNRTVLVAVGMGILMIIGIIVTVKDNYFAHSDE